MAMDCSQRVTEGKTMGGWPMPEMIMAAERLLWVRAPLTDEGSRLEPGVIVRWVSRVDWVMLRARRRVVSLLGVRATGTGWLVLWQNAEAFLMGGRTGGAIVTGFQGVCECCEGAAAGCAVEGYERLLECHSESFVQVVVAG